MDTRASPGTFGASYAKIASGRLLILFVIKCKPVCPPPPPPHSLPCYHVGFIKISTVLPTSRKFGSIIQKGPKIMWLEKLICGGNFAEITHNWKNYWSLFSEAVYFIMCNLFRRFYFIFPYKIFLGHLRSKDENES